MPSITTWNRLEPIAAGDDSEEGLQARVHDPLWMLARQWQFGELKGEDRGSPVEARLRSISCRLTRFRPGLSGATTDYDRQAQPLEVLVEGETSAEVSPRVAARAGLRFLRQLRSDPRLSIYAARIIRAYGFQPIAEERDPTVIRFLESVQGRAPDGRRLHAAHRQAFLEDGSLATARPQIQIEESDAPAFRAALAEWMRFHFTLFEPRNEPSSWMPRRMEYRFAVAAHSGEKEITLEAEEYRGGRLDWHSFRRGESPLSAQPRDASGGTTAVEQEHRMLPGPVNFPGMPMPRWWQFEDSRVDWGSVSAGSFDLARMLLVDFALSYGNDWYLVPLDLDVGSWCRISSLTVRNTFGEEFEIPPVSDGDPGSWQMFAVSGGKPGEGLFLPPVLARTLSGEPLEEVRLARDEMANYAWAIEKVVENLLGRPTRRAEETRRQTPPPPAGEGTLKYRLASTVPDYWLPLVPVAETPGGRSIRFRLGRLESSAGPRGRLLEELAAANPPTLFEEEIPRAGAVITRVPQLARWIDGSTHAWTGRDKNPGRGEAGSGLRFDIVE